MNTNLRPSGIDRLGDMAWGAHCCLLYETKEDLLDFFIPYFKTGLEHNELCLYVASEPLITEEAAHAMRAAFPDFERYLAKEQIEITPYTDWYLNDGRFDEQHVLQCWIDKLKQALGKGFSGLRFAVNMSLEKDDWGSFAVYEEMLEKTLHGLQIKGLCAYSLHHYSAVNMLDVIHHHQFTLARRKGIWEPLEGFKLKHVHEEYLKLNAELEQRVIHRTAELAAINEKLKLEIVERERAQTLLQAKEKEFRAIVESAPDLIIRYDRNLNRTYINPAVTKGYDLPKEKFVEKPIGSIVADAQLVVDTSEVDALKQKIQSVFDTGEPTEYEVTWPLPSGRRTFWSRLFPERDSNGVVINVLGIARDITERKHMEEALRRSEANFRILAEKSVQGIAIYQDQKMVYANESIVRITGYTIEELKSMPADQIVARTHPIDRPIAEERLRKHTAGEELSASVELRISRKDGSIGWVQAFNNSIEYNGRPALLSTAIDITERKQAEEALRKSENNFRTLAEKSLQGIVIFQDQKIVYVNPAHSTTTGYSIEELKAMSLEQIVSLAHPLDRDMAFERARRRMAGEQISPHIELQIVRKDGVTRWIQTFNNAIEYYGRPALLSMTVDITERKQAEEALRKSERVLREAEVLGHTGSWEQNLVTGEIFNTEENLRLFFGDDDSKGEGFEDYAQVVHPDDREYVMQRRVELLEEDGPSDIEYRVVWPDGSVHVIFGRATVVRNELGQPIRVYGTNVDITARKRAEEELRLSEQRLQLLTETIPILVWSARADGVSDYYNAAFLQYLGRTLEEMQGWVWVETLHPDDRERSSALWTQAFSTGSAYEIEYRIRRAADGQYRWHLGRAVPLRDATGNIVRWYGTCTDIHDQKQAEEKIRQYVTRMEALAEISHALAEVGLDYESVLETLAQRTAELIGDSCVITLFSDDKQQSFPVAFYHSDAKAKAMMYDALLHTWEGGTDTQRYQNLLAGNSIFFPEVNQDEFRASLEPEFLPYFEAIGITSTIIVPLQVQGYIIGTLGITRDRHGSLYTQDDQVLLQDLADRAALIIQNAQLFKQVETAREQLAALSHRILEVQESERRSLTTELHDRVGQNLTGLSILLQNMKVFLSGETAQTLAGSFDDAQAAVEDTTRQIRHIMAELHPPELEDYGLAVALETYAERTASRGNLELIVDLPDLEPSPLPSDTSIALFRAAQEAINNVLKHANATQMEIGLGEQDGKIRIRVEDNGIGFKPDAPSQKGAQTWGLKIMRERIEAIGGEVDIKSEPGQGTRVTFEIKRPV